MSDQVLIKTKQKRDEIKKRINRRVSQCALLSGASLLAALNPISGRISPLHAATTFSLLPLAATGFSAFRLQSLEGDYDEYLRLDDLAKGLQEKRDMAVFEGAYEPEQVQQVQEERVPSEDEIFSQRFHKLIKAQNGIDVMIGAKELFDYNSDGEPTHVRYRVFYKDEVVYQQVVDAIKKSKADLSSKLGMLNPTLTETLGGVYLVCENLYHQGWQDPTRILITTRGYRKPEKTFAERIIDYHFPDQSDVEQSVESTSDEPIHQPINWHPQPEGLRKPAEPIYQQREYTVAEYFSGQVPGFQWLSQFVNFPGVLVHGAQGSGKTSFATALVRAKAIAGHRLQVLDPHKIYGHWQGLDCVGEGMNYQEIDNAMEEFISEVKRDYQLLASVPNYQPSYKTVICEELTNYASRCNNTEEFFMMSISDIRKANKCVLYLSHGRTLATLGNAKGVAKTRDNSLLELELFSKPGPDGRAIPTFKGKLKLPGGKPIDVDIPKFKDLSTDFSDLYVEEDPYKEFDEEFKEDYGFDPDDVINPPKPVVQSDPIDYVFQNASDNPSFEEIRRLWREAGRTEYLSDNAVNHLIELIKKRRESK